MNNMKKNGYERFDLMQDLKYEGIENDYKEILESFSNLPEDNYAVGLNRYRRYSRAIILPGTEEVCWLPTIQKNDDEYSAYFQGKFNPDFPDAYREFHSIRPEILNNNLLLKIIKANYKETFWKEEDKILPIHVGVHFVKLHVKSNDEKAVSSPDCLHQDGEPFTFAHLIERKNIIGGINTIGLPKAAGNLPNEVNQDDLIETFELKKPLESYGVFDTAVSHYVSPVMKIAGKDEGLRSVILIDFQQTVVAEL